MAGVKGKSGRKPGSISKPAPRPAATPPLAPSAPATPAPGEGTHASEVARSRATLAAESQVDGRGTSAASATPPPAPGVTTAPPSDAMAKAWGECAKLPFFMASVKYRSAHWKLTDEEAKLIGVSVEACFQKYLPQLNFEGPWGPLYMLGIVVSTVTVPRAVLQMQMLTGATAPRPIAPVNTPVAPDETGTRAAGKPETPVAPPLPPKPESKTPDLDLAAFRGGPSSML